MEPSAEFCSYRIAVRVLACLLTIAPLAAHAQQRTPPTATQQAARDGRHDFDWDIGLWKVHQRRLLHPLTGSTTWVDYDGTDNVQKIWEGANSGIVESDGSAGHLEIYTLRLYDPDARRWSIYFANRAGGGIGTPVAGTFNNGQGEFIDHETYKDKTIMVRFRVFDIQPNSCRFDQSFSADEGKTWETNFLVKETRVPAP